MTQPQLSVWKKIWEKELAAKVKAQKELCEKKELPFFVPAACACPKCNTPIFDLYTEEECGEEHITHCKWCHYSFCD